MLFEFGSVSTSPERWLESPAIQSKCSEIPRIQRKSAGNEMAEQHEPLHIGHLSFEDFFRLYVLEALEIAILGAHWN